MVKFLHNQCKIWASQNFDGKINFLAVNNSIDLFNLTQ